MEGMAIFLLLTILVIGLAIFFTFFKFLSTSQENQRRYEEIQNQLVSLQRKLENLAPPATENPNSQPPPLTHAQN